MLLVTRKYPSKLVNLALKKNPFLNVSLGKFQKLVGDICPSLESSRTEFSFKLTILIPLCLYTFCTMHSVASQILLTDCSRPSASACFLPAPQLQPNANRSLIISWCPGTTSSIVFFTDAAIAIQRRVEISYSNI